MGRLLVRLSVCQKGQAKGQVVLEESTTYHDTRQIITITSLVPENHPKWPQTDIRYNTITTLKYDIILLRQIRNLALGLRV